MSTAPRSEACSSTQTGSGSRTRGDGQALGIGRRRRSDQLDPLGTDQPGQRIDRRGAAGRQRVAPGEADRERAGEVEVRGMDRRQLGNLVERPGPGLGGPELADGVHALLGGAARGEHERSADGVAFDHPVGTERARELTGDAVAGGVEDDQRRIAMHLHAQCLGDRLVEGDPAAADGHPDPPGATAIRWTPSLSPTAASRSRAAASPTASSSAREKPLIISQRWYSVTGSSIRAREPGPVAAEPGVARRAGCADDERRAAVVVAPG